MREIELYEVETPNMDLDLKGPLVDLNELPTITGYQYKGYQVRPVNITIPYPLS